MLASLRARMGVAHVRLLLGGMPPLHARRVPERAGIPCVCGGVARNGATRLPAPRTLTWYDPHFFVLKIWYFCRVRFFSLTFY